MEGTLLVPPERGTIIGRAVWKPRYVVVASRQAEQQLNLTSSQAMAASRMQAASRASNAGGQSKASPDALYLSIYKTKGDWECVQQHALSSVTDCQIQQVAHRKQGPVLPTLILSISPDPATDKLRKRRSSRTAGLTSTKEKEPTTLWFRPGDDKYSLQDWARFLYPLIQQNLHDRPPMSPITPASPNFVNPFSARREASDAYQRPASGHGSHWGGLHHKGSSHTHSSSGRERPLTFSDSPSLRSKRSDVSSSHASSMIPPQMGYQHYTAMPQPHVAELPSPAATVGDYQGEFIEGWTSAQGRASALSSPVRGRESSISSQAPSQSIAATMESSSPPAPRETILDRAFQLRCIPGSEREIPGEEKLSSLARFDALMREADEKRKIREAEEARLRAESEPKSAWDLDDDSDSDEMDDDDDEDDDDSDDIVGELNDSEHGFPLPSTAQRALHYIASRHDAAPVQRFRAQTGRALNYNAETLMALSSGAAPMRPQTSYSRNRPGMSQRTHSQPQLAEKLAASGNIAALERAAVGVRGSDDGTLTAKGSPLQRSQTEKRLSTSSAKRGSFTEFTKRLSSTSSLLLVQTNASSTSAASSRGSTDTAGEGSHQQGLRGALQHRGVRSPTPRADRDSADKACNWRGSVGVFGEGGFV